MDKIREEFESWLMGMSLKQINAICEDSAWQAWQASRAALVVNTSELRRADYYVSGTVYLDDVEDALDKAGIKYE